MVDDGYVVLLLMGQSSGQVFGGFGNFCGADSLTLAVHMSFWSLLGCWEEFCNIFDVDERPGEIISTLQMALSHEALVGKPATPCRYQMVGLTLGSS